MSDRDEEARDEGSHDPEAPKKKKKKRRVVEEAHDEAPVAPPPVHSPPSSDGPEDPYWWTPHAVLFTLVMIGVWGFFGGLDRFVGGGHDAPKADQPAAAVAAEPTEVGAQHLLVMHKESQRVPPGITRSKEEAKARATEALGKLKSGKSFDDVVKEYSDEPGAKDRSPPGTLGNFAKGAMVAPFSEAAFKLKVGEQSGLVETPFGYHIIKRTK